MLGYDNAHGIPSKPSITAHDHMHKSNKIIQYAYKDAAELLRDFWKDVDRILKRKKQDESCSYSKSRNCSL